MGAGHQVDLGENAGLFQVAVGDGPVEVFEGDQVSLDVSRERVAPDVALAGVVEVDASHAGLGCVRGSQEGRFLWHHFGEVSRSAAKVGGQAGEGGEAVTHEGGDADPVAGCLVLGPLQGAEEAGGARDGDGHEA